MTLKPPDGATGPLLEGDEGFVSVADHGAAADGTRDDTTAIQAAITAAEAVNGTVFFPAGTYKTTTALTISEAVRLVGTGMVSTVIQNSASNVFTTAAATVTDVTFADMHIQSASGGGHIFAPAVNASTLLGRWVFDRVRLTQSNTAKSLWQQVDAGGLVGSRWNDCLLYHAQGATVPGFYLKGAGQLMNTNTWTRCVPTYSGEYFFHIENTSAGYAYDNAFRDCYGEVLVGGFAKILSGKNTIFDNVSNFDMQTVGDSTRDWLYIGKSASGLASQFTTFRNCSRAGGTLGSGLVDIKLESGTVGRTTVSNSHTDALTGYAIDCGSNSVEFEGHLTGLTLTNLHTPSVASAASLSLPSGAFRNPGWSQVTGSTTITSLGATFPGHLVTLKFSSATIPQVTDGGNIVLAGNFPSGATPNSTLQLLCDGSTWFEVGRSINS